MEMKGLSCSDVSDGCGRVSLMVTIVDLHYVASRIRPVDKIICSLILPTHL